MQSGRHHPERTRRDARAPDRPSSAGSLGWGWPVNWRDISLTCWTPERVEGRRSLLVRANLRWWGRCAGASAAGFTSLVLIDRGAPAFLFAPVHRDRGVLGSRARLDPRGHPRGRWSPGRTSPPVAEPVPVNVEAPAAAPAEGEPASADEFRNGVAGEKRAGRNVIARTAMDAGLVGSVRTGTRPIAALREEDPDLFASCVLRAVRGA